MCKKELNLQIFRLMIWLQKLVYLCWDIIKDYLILEECNNQSKLLSNSTQNWPNIVQNQSKKCQYCFKSDIIGHKVYRLQSQTHKSKATYSFIDLKISRYIPDEFIHSSHWNWKLLFIPSLAAFFNSIVAAFATI